MLLSVHSIKQRLLNPNKNPENQSVAVQVILRGKKMSFELFSKNSLRTGIANVFWE